MASVCLLNARIASSVVVDCANIESVAVLAESWVLVAWGCTLGIELTGWARMGGKPGRVSCCESITMSSLGLGLLFFRRFAGGTVASGSSFGAAWAIGGTF